jgi:hypothetical protein
VTREPNQTTVTPSGITIEYYDSIGVDGAKQQRRYLVDGERLPSVTTITGILDKSQALIPWAVKLTQEGKDWREVRDSAGERGVSAHDLIVRLMTREDAPQALSGALPDEHRPYGQAAARWLLRRKPELIEAEQMVVGRISSNGTLHGFAGRFDLLCRLDGTPTRVDFKTTSWRYQKLRKDEKWPGRKYPPYPENAIQLSAYELAARHSSYEPSERLLIVRLGDDGTFDETEVGYNPDWFEAVFAAFRARKSAEKELRAA